MKRTNNRSKTPLKVSSPVTAVPFIFSQTEEQRVTSWVQNSFKVISSMLLQVSTRPALFDFKIYPGVVVKNLAFYILMFFKQHDLLFWIQMTDTRGASSLNKKLKRKLFFSHIRVMSQQVNTFKVPLRGEPNSSGELDYKYILKLLENQRYQVVWVLQQFQRTRIWK